jgi:adenosylcobyric acid synthase
MKTVLMVWGASSGAGKSLLATALCGWAARGGLRVAPFKAHNMSNNARVEPGPGGIAGLANELGEIGSAQCFQALEARVPPQMDMPPVLFETERDTASKVVPRGRVDVALSRQPWRQRSALLAAAARQSFDRLAERFEMIVIEGAGSPAEINLAPQDYVNLGTARWARERGVCKALLVADIDRGGVFAYLYGSWALLPDDLRPLLAGCWFNKFRGDAAVLAPGPEQLQLLTGVPLLGVLPMQRDHGLPEKDGLYTTQAGPEGGPRIAIVAGPHISNLDEFQPLIAAASVRWVRHADELEGAGWVLLPGSKQTSGDLAWLRAQGLDAAVVAHAQASRPVLGICGGLQMLGQSLADPAPVDGEAFERLPGLGLLPLASQYAAPERLRAGRVGFAPRLGTADAPTGPVASPGRCGVARLRDPPRPYHHHASGSLAGAVRCRRRALGLVSRPRPQRAEHATQGLLENAASLRALLGLQVRTLDQSFDGLADLIDHHLGAATWRALLKA